MIRLIMILEKTAQVLGVLGIVLFYFGVLTLDAGTWSRAAIGSVVILLLGVFLYAAIRPLARGMSASDLDALVRTGGKLSQREVYAELAIAKDPSGVHTKTSRALLEEVAPHKLVTPDPLVQIAGDFALAKRRAEFSGWWPTPILAILIVVGANLLISSVLDLIWWTSVPVSLGVAYLALSRWIRPYLTERAERQIRDAKQTAIEAFNRAFVVGSEVRRKAVMSMGLERPWPAVVAERGRYRPVDDLTPGDRGKALDLNEAISAIFRGLVDSGQLDQTALSQISESQEQESEQHAQQYHEAQLDNESLKLCAEAVYTKVSPLIPTIQREGFEHQLKMVLEGDHHFDQDKQILKQRFKEICGDWRIYGQEMLPLRQRLRRAQWKSNCLECGAQVSVNITTLEQELLDNKVTQLKIGHGNLVIFEPDWTKGGLCKSESGLLCASCARRALETSPDAPNCPKCGQRISGMDHLTD